MTAGAVTANSQDGGSVWYNPAGLGAIRRAQIDLSGSTYGLRVRPVSALLTSNFPGTAATLDANAVDIISAPNAVSFVRGVSSRVTLGFGAFITERDIRNISSTAEQAVTNGNVQGTYRQRVDFENDSTIYHLGPAVGVALSDNLRLGLSAFFSYTTVSSFLQYEVDAHGSNSATNATAMGNVLAQERESFRGFGGQAALGLQWTFVHHWDLGVVVRSPEFLFGSTISGATLQSSAATGSTTQGTSTFTLSPTATSGGNVELIGPPRLTVGLSHSFDDDGSFIGLDVDAQSPLSNANQGIDRQVVVNARLGARWQISRRIALGAGAFTDFAPTSLGDTFGDESVSYFGGTIGFQFRTPLALVANPKPDALVLVTTLSVRYAAGVGQIRGTYLDTDTGVETPRTVNVLYQEVVPYIGSSLLF